MSAALLSALGVATYQNLSSVLLKSGRRIAGIIPDCAISERHIDEIEITSHPVETGSPIHDHAFKRPAEVTLRWGWSAGTIASRIQGAISSGDISSLGNNPALDIYSQLLELQSSFEYLGGNAGLTLVTGKRTYDNVLMRSLNVETTRETENVLIIEAVFQEIRIVNTAATASTGQQANPAKTGSVSNAGTKQLMTLGSIKLPKLPFLN